MGLNSNLFKGDPKLEACLISDPAHVTLGARGEHVGKIQFAITATGLGVISADEIAQQFYGPSTANAVLGFKRTHNIINRTYQQTADNIVGKMTIAELDKIMVEFERRTPPAPPTPPNPNPSPQPPKPPSPVEPVSTGFALRGALAQGRHTVFITEPPDGDPTTVSSDTPPNCFEVFDVDNMQVGRFDGQHAAIYFFEAPGVFPVHVDPQHYRRLPRIFRLRTAIPLSSLSCQCRYRTIQHGDGRRESFLDLRLRERTVSVPMFIHFPGGPSNANQPAVTQSMEGRFRFSHLGL